MSCAIEGCGGVVRRRSSRFCSRACRGVGQTRAALERRATCAIDGCKRRVKRPGALYCSVRCRGRAKSLACAKRRESPRLVLYPRHSLECLCGTSFRAGSGDGMFCSEMCAKAYANRITCPCGRRFRASDGWGLYCGHRCPALAGLPEIHPSDVSVRASLAA